MINYLKTALKGATSIFIALVGVLLIIWFYMLANDYYEKSKAKPYQAVKVWSYSVKDTLGIDVKAKTKLIDGTLHGVLQVEGYPKFFDDEINQDKSIIIEFHDSDGFVLLTQNYELRNFTKLVDATGNSLGLEAQFEQPILIDTYKRFTNLIVRWTLITEQKPEIEMKKKELLDHCAVKLSKSERLKRLSQYGEIRETGIDTYESSGHSITFNYDGSLIYCN